MAVTPINPTHTTAAMTASSAAVLAANTSRRYALLVNDGVADVYITLGATAVANQGIRVGGNGGSYELSPEFGNLYRGAIDRLPGSGTSTMLVLEGI